MFAKILDFLRAALVSPAPQPPAATQRSERVALVAAALGFGLWVFAYKMKTFLGLGTTSDLYSFVQWSTAWPGKGFYHDNLFGNVLAIHAYLLCPVLGILAYPFGAVGLFMILAVAGTLNLLAGFRMVQLLGVPARWALVFSCVITLMPLSVHVYKNDIYGFHVELLEPTLALWLAYYLFRRAPVQAILVAMGLLCVKEDAPLLVMGVAAVVLGEDMSRAILARRQNRGPGKAWNAPAFGVLVLGALAVPALLYFIKTQQPAVAAINLERLNPVDAGGIASNRDLVVYVVTHLRHWIGSTAVTDWAGMAMAATIGLGWLRPHLLWLGLVTTVVAWLMRDQLIWAPRFVQALALFQVVACLGFVSACRVVAGLNRAGKAGRWLAVTGVAGMVVAAGWALARQMTMVPKAGEFYGLSPELRTSRDDRRRADRVFARYRQESHRAEPVLASHYLFRYAHDRNMLWPQGLRGRPHPEWILWDTEESPLAALWVFLKTDAGTDLADYESLGDDGRFLLLKRRPGGGSGRTIDAGLPRIMGEAHGAVRMRVRFPAGRAGHTEPLLSVGETGQGDVFHVRYVDAHQLILGMENMGAVVHESDLLDFEPGREYEMELFSGSLVPPPDESGGLSAAARAYYKTLVSMKYDGREVLKEQGLAHKARPEEVHAGANLARAGSAGMAFSGVIRDVRRGGYPPLPGIVDAEHGALRIRIRLPAAAAETPEPLLVMGVSGEALIGYVRVLPGGRIKVGVEFWGFGAYESEEMPADSREPVDIVFALPALFPHPGDREWGDVPLAKQERARTQLKILVNDTVALDRVIAVPRLSARQITLGTNPVGGSYVGSAFTGEVLWALRLPLAEP